MQQEKRDSHLGPSDQIGFPGAVIFSSDLKEEELARWREKEKKHGSNAMFLKLKDSGYVWVGERADVAGR